ncbi:pkinase-domain-containing protein [Lasallia pustulata]|uniref:non-specific serine/threonine protein kinase n=1 Tax=Lasallia pustulata TaxID=136370 RepID=A0A1W5CRZ7_9LECA|nr:pkinase-domain-containing protein [Lasallia pustulata]
MASTFDDEELSMSLSGVSERRPSRLPPPSKMAPQRPLSNASSASKQEQRVGQYTILKTLGEGSFGKVKLAVHRVSGQEVALKIISRKKLISRDMAGRVEREIQYLQLLRHPHIIKLYTVITTGSEIIMVLEYAGGELFDYIVKHGKMPEDTARRFFQQIVCAVEYCHRHKIVHRDLKPENLLLDGDLNVKIADFGLSNIMTDGNFLKTSCGSPNYAAPEVISGKLYAGPEVDVWSCGVILYVLLCGRLPFDDEFIPALFKKISTGSYHVPSYLSSGARNIIHKMLKVNPVQRITVQEIRQDPWFNEGLADYLKPPVEEFIDTGVDPNKAIDPRKLAPGKPAAVQEQIHESVIGKLGKTMGYAKDDVQEALGKDEPNAIKDAYLIVRENQMMQTNPSLSTAQNAFLASSPPAWDDNMPSSPQGLASALSKAAQAHTKAPSSSTQHAPNPTRSSAKAPEPKKEYVSKIGILASSMPYYHNQYMEQQKANIAAAIARPDAEELDPHEAEYFSKLSLVPNPKEQSSEDQAATARRLKPHSRSTIQLQSITANAAEMPDSMTQVSAKKARSTKWQFGIRSRNLPFDAMICIYKALAAHNAQWEMTTPPPTPPDHGPAGYPVNVKGAVHADDTLSHSSGSQEAEKSAHARDHGHPVDQYMPNFGFDGSEADDGSTLKRENSDDSIDPNVIPEGYIPKDPWCIRVRWRKDGMYPPGTTLPSSAHSSRIDLTNEEQARRRGSAIGGLSSAAGSATSVGGQQAVADSACYVYMDVQLYTLEQDTYLVDFKCAGYESMVEVAGAVGEAEKRLVGSGYRVLDKDVTSPQPFLDLTNKLVIHLARG